jgi:hypothetical protein
MAEETVVDGRREPALPEASSQPSLHTFACPACGGAIELRAAGLSVTAACGACGALVDVNDERYRLIERAEQSQRIPALALGSRGRIGDGLYEVIGYLQRAEGSFVWDEYLLFNPYLGFRWLVDVDGHWNFVTMLRDQVPGVAGQPTIRFEGQDFHCYNRGKAEVRFVLGEFYWRVKVGETVTGTDYISPPYMLSAEESDDETVWSLGKYMSAKVVEKAFDIQLVGASGTGPNQPSPFAPLLGPVWKTTGMALIGVLFCAFVMSFVHPTTDIFRGTIPATTVAAKQTAVLGSFRVPDKSGELSIDTLAPLNNSWVEVNYSLVNKQTNESYDFTQSMEYYSGVDSDGAWSEGSWNGDGVLSAVPGGDYDLVADIAFGDSSQAPEITFDVRRHPHSLQPLLIAIGLLLVLPLLLSGMHLGFERSRRNNSDYDASGTHKKYDGDDN